MTCSMREMITGMLNLFIRTPEGVWEVIFCTMTAPIGYPILTEVEVRFLMSSYIVIMISVSTEEEAKSIGLTLVKEKWVACSNIIPAIHSMYHWQGNFCEENEVLLICKSLQFKLNGIVDRVRQLHSYDVPEIIALPIVGGSEEYLKWLKASVT